MKTDRAIRMARTRRYNALFKQARPCPRCGAEVEIDLGFSDAEFAAGQEGFGCPAYINTEFGLVPCAVSATGLHEWNTQPYIDQLQAEIAGLRARLVREKPTSE